MENSQDTHLELVHDGKPDIDDVCSLYHETVNDYTNYEQLQNENWDARHMHWPGQSRDQRRHGTRSQPAFPWEGASDLRVPVIDETIIFSVALDMIALKRANIRAVPIGSDDLAKAAVMGNFMRWLILSQMKERRTEAEIASQYRHGRGLGLMRVGWEKYDQRVQQEVTLEGLAQAMPDVVQSLQTGAFDDDVAALFVQLGEQSGNPVSKKRAKRMVKELRETGVTTIPVKRGTVNRPVLKTLAVGEDVFMPRNTPVDLQKARMIFERVYLSPADSRAKVATDGWDEEYVDYVAERCVSMEATAGDVIDSEHRYNTERMSSGTNGTGVRDGLIEWVYAYQKLSDEDGIPGIYCTIFCPAAKTGDNPIGYAKQELLPYAHGKYPYVPFPRERLSRYQIDSRAVPEVGSGWQNAIKVEIDSRIDAASLATCPPRFHPYGREPSEWGPNASVPVRRPGEYGYLQGPQAPQASVEVQTTLQNMVRHYFGRTTSDSDANEAAIKQQKQVDDFLEPWQEVMTMAWELYRQYGPDEEFFRVLGVPQEKAQQFRKDEYSEKYDFYMTFDVLSLDPEQMIARLEKMGQIAAQWDRNGQIDSDAFLREFMGAIDPILAEKIILPKETAANKEIMETQADIAKMWAGVDVDAPPNASVQLRMQTIQQWAQGSPDNPAVDVQQRLQADQALQKRVQRYSEQLQFQQQQRENAQIGRIGTRPSYS